MKLLRIIARAIVLIVVWAGAVWAGLACWGRFSDHRNLAREVRVLETRHTDQMNNYSGALADGEKLKSDPEAQVKLLKDKMGYARRNETPIVVTIEDDPNPSAKVD